MKQTIALDPQPSYQGKSCISGDQSRKDVGKTFRTAWRSSQSNHNVEIAAFRRSGNPPPFLMGLIDRTLAANCSC
jgi:hypothetical protein